jgi:pimeloyl-ACP methyl ester carboxylesterase
LIALALCVGTITAQAASPERLRLHDTPRDRDVPVVIYRPAPGSCAQPPCSVALLSPGSGLGPEAYSFVAERLNARGLLVVAVQHELPGDAPVPSQGNLWTVRSPFWARGVANLRFVAATLAAREPAFDWHRPVLVGHSMGGDISAWWLRAEPTAARSLITLDHRRVPLPRDTGVAVLSLRSSDQPADPGVLPPPGGPACVIPLREARHNDMHDGGPAELRGRIGAAIDAFLQGQGCQLSG